MKGPKAQKTEQERALEEVSVAQWNDYVTRFIPAESELIKQSELTEGERASVKGQASADTASAFKGLTRDTLAASEAGGADVSSGKAKFGLASNADARGRALGLGAAVAETGAEISRDKQQTGIVALGRQIAADTTADLSAGARRASRVALAEAASKFERNSAIINAGAVVGGAALRKYQLAKEAKLADTREVNKERMGGGQGAPNFAARYYKDPWAPEDDPFVNSLLRG
jgi:hypothetical protein